MTRWRCLVAKALCAIALGEALPFTLIQSPYKTSFDVTKDFAGIKAD